MCQQQLDWWSAVILLKKIQIAWHYPHNPYILGNMPHFCPGNFFSLLHYIPLDNHWIDHSYQFQLPNPSMRHADAHQKKMSSQFERKPLITQILKRWLLVAKKVPYKFPNNIASKLSTLHAINWRFVCQAKNAESFRSTQFLKYLFFRKFDKITKLHLSYVNFPADSKYVLEILISCLVSEIWPFWGYLTSSSFLKLILVWFWCLNTHFKTYDLLYKNLSSNDH